MKIIKTFQLAGLAWFAAASIGHAADMTPAYKMPMKAVAPVATWTGFYIGGNVGYGWDTGSTGVSARATDPVLAPILAGILAAGSYPTSLSSSPKGVIGGAQAGYNWQMSQWLFGLEADIQGSGIKGTATQALTPALFDATSTGVTKSIDWFGTARARLGVLATPQWLLYATGGLAYGQTKTGFTTTDTTFGCLANATICANGGSSSSVRAGWTVGAGTEAMLGANWSVKFEYLYVDLGRRSVDTPVFTVPAIIFTTSTAFREQIVRVGLNYHFDMGGPVVARY